MGGLIFDPHGVAENHQGSRDPDADSMGARECERSRALNPSEAFPHLLGRTRHTA